MSFLFRNITDNNQLPNADVPKGVNLKYTNFAKPKEGGNEGYNSQKLTETSFGNKTRSNITKSGRPGTGWEDDDDDSNSINQNHNQNSSKTFSSNNGKQSNGSKAPNSNSSNNEYTLYSAESLSEQNIEYEIKIISEVIQPQGARVKPSDNLLIPFGKACESFKTELVGSILLSNFMTDVPWLILMFFNELMIPQDENQAAQISNLNSNVLAILENQIKTEKIHQDDFMLKNLAKIQENNAKDLLDLDGKKEGDSNKKKLNAFDMFNNKPQASVNQTISNSNQNQNLLQTQNLDILDAGNLLSNEASHQNADKKRKFKFANKPEPQQAIDQIKNDPPKEMTVKQQKFDPFSLNSTKPQEKPQVKEVDNKTKKFKFIENNHEKDNNSLMNLDLNLNEDKGTKTNINLMYSAENKGNNLVNFQQGMTGIALTSNNQNIPLNVNNQNQNIKLTTSYPNMNPTSKSALDNLYNNYNSTAINPTMTNFHYPQMNIVPNYPMGMNNMGMQPMNMGAINMGAMNMGAMNMGAMNMGAMNMGTMNMGAMNMGAMNMAQMGPMNMGSMNMGPLNMGQQMHVGPSLGMGNVMGMNATIGMNMNNMNNPVQSEMRKTLENEKKEPKKVLDESAFDFIKF